MLFDIIILAPLILLDAVSGRLPRLVRHLGGTRALARLYWETSPWGLFPHVYAYARMRELLPEVAALRLVELSSRIKRIGYEVGFGRLLFPLLDDLIETAMPRDLPLAVGQDVRPGRRLAEWDLQPTEPPRRASGAGSEGKAPNVSNVIPFPGKGARRYHPTGRR